MTSFDFQLVLLIGAGRSGTTLLAEHILAHHPEIAYWSEPNHIWSYGALYSRDDVRDASEVTDVTRRRIVEAFHSQWDDQGRKEILLEKTPANCLRLPFIRELFPDAKFIHLVRDGRDVALSARIEWSGGKSVQKTENASLVNRISDGLKVVVEQIFLRDLLSTFQVGQLPYYAWRALDTVRARVLGRHTVWGPRIPNLREIASEHSLLETCAIQWRECVESVLAEWSDIPEKNRLELRYEDLLEAPEQEVSRVLEFVGLPATESVQAQLDQIRPGNKRKWTAIAGDEGYEELMNHIGETLRKLGYETRREGETAEE